ncbi:hypothetical protein ACFRI7_32250 [Streptomyces sp. NPDC056716]|uniref:hypothetical protein n=1 Tax=unclassified Streptomyces TaxID=2593676 RepID=UPI0036D19DB4
MKTCHRFTRIKTGHERHIQILLSHAARHPDRPTGRASAKRAVGAKYAMARALNLHFDRCRECG